MILKTFMFFSLMNAGFANAQISSVPLVRVSFREFELAPIQYSLGNASPIILYRTLIYSQGSLQFDRSTEILSNNSTNDYCVLNIFYAPLDASDLFRGFVVFPEMRSTVFSRERRILDQVITSNEGRLTYQFSIDLDRNSYSVFYDGMRAIRIAPYRIYCEAKIDTVQPDTAELRAKIVQKAFKGMVEIESIESF